ncbi:MAG: TIM barrel protein [Nanoarchaeota archaeon]
MISFGPAGLGPVKTAIGQLEQYHKLGFRACEIAFTYSAYIKSQTDAQAIGAKARELGISLSIHGSYFINLNAKEQEKAESTKQRILEACKVGHWLGAKTLVIHPGYYSDDKEQTYLNVKNRIAEILKEIKKNNWSIKLAPETMGKVNVFGSVEEVSRLVRDTGCSFCIDFAHILARDKSVDYSKVKALFPQKEWHVHFSGIIYGDKGEKSHKTTTKEEWNSLLKELPKDKSITIINESPTMIQDSQEGLKIYKKIS